MKLQEMVDLIRQHHPDMGLEESVRMINRAQDDFTSKTRMIKEANQFPLNDNEVNQRYYQLDPSFLEILRVEVENKDGDMEVIKRSMTIPNIRDFT